METIIDVLFTLPKALAQDQKASLEHLLSVCPSLDHLRVFLFLCWYPRNLIFEIGSDLRW